MRRKDREITDKQEIRAVLGAVQVCRIALCDGDRPYIVPVNFGVDGDRLYFHCASEGKKLDLIRANPNICFEVDTDYEVIAAEAACAWTAHFRSVVGYGRATIVDDLLEKVSGLSALMRQVSEKEYEFPVEEVRGVTVIRIDIESMTGKKAGF